MLPPIEEYKYNQNIDGIEDIAYNTLFEKYMIQNLRGIDKKTEITSTDQESILVELRGGYPLPGFTYTFMYKGPDLKIAEKQFSDLVPIVFCMNSGMGNYFTGINMNLLPPNVRLQFLQSFYETFESFYKREVDVLAQNQKLALNKRFINLIKSGQGQEMIKIFNSKNRQNFNFGYRQYKLGYVRNFRMIEYDELKYLPFYTCKDAFRKINHAQIHKLYERSK